MSLARERGLNGAKRWSMWQGLGNSLIESGLGEIVYFEQVGWFSIENVQSTLRRESNHINFSELDQYSYVYY